MKKIFLIFVSIFSIMLLAISLLGIIKVTSFQNFDNNSGIETTLFEKMLKLSSKSFENGKSIPSKYTCDGQNINPPLTISGVSAEAKSLAIIVDDPDALMGTFTHWLVWDIPPSVTEINEGEVPSESVLGVNDFGVLEYKGPCPPSGTHRYFFKLYALNQLLNLKQGSSKDELLKAMDGKIIEKTELVGTYKRG